MKHNWIECVLEETKVDDNSKYTKEGYFCSECEKSPRLHTDLSSECSGYIGVERDYSKVLNSRKFSFREWFDNLFPSSGFAGYSPFYAFTHPHKIVEFCFDEIKYAWQRVFRGWDDRVIWSVDIYLTEKIPLWLKELQISKVGVPIGFFENPEKVEFSDEEHKSAKANWNKELQVMIDGFTASKKIQNCDWNTREEEKELVEIFEKGMKSFTDNYFSLWD